MLSQTDILDVAEALDNAEKSRQQIGLVSLLHPAMTLDEAYAVQRAWVTKKKEAGRKVVGWKIGLTSKAMQHALNISTPDSGVLFDDMLFEDGGIIAADRFIQPRIEAELAFIMKAPLRGENVSVSDVLAATAFVVPALEILDTRIVRTDRVSGKSRTIIDTVSDNAANAGIVLGNQLFVPEQVDMRWTGAIVSRNATVEETGLAAGVLNHPARGIAWLANRLLQYGDYIEAGQIVLAGSFIRPVEARHGDTIHADFGPQGSVSCYFE